MDKLKLETVLAWQSVSHENVVDAIKSHACHKIYIAETGRRLRENIYISKGYQTPFFLLLPRVTRLRTCWFLSSIRVSRMPQADAVLRPGWFSDTAPYTLDVSMRALSRCDRCFYLNVTSHTLFFNCCQTTDGEGVPWKRLVTITIFARKFELSLIVISIIRRAVRNGLVTS